MNWGYKLMTAFLVFIGGMGYLVYRSMHTNYELVEKEYYKSELKYQSRIDATRQAGALLTPVQLEQDGASIFLQMPPDMQSDSLEGNIWFYCAYDATKDRQFPLRTDAAGRQSFGDSLLQSGHYLVKLEWKHGGVDYYLEKNIELE